MGSFYIDDVSKNKNRIEYVYHFDDGLSSYIFDNPRLYIEYQENIEQVPESICVIPLVCNVLPIIWLLDVDLYISELDKKFYDSIEDFKKGYQRMYPKLQFKGKIHVSKVVDNNENIMDSTATFFSGGLDAMSTLLTHVNEHPDLITLWGSDIDVDDYVTFKKVEKSLKYVGKTLNCKNVIIRTNFRKILNEKNLDKLVYHKVHDRWWHGFQHGIAIISHSFPYAYKHKIKTVYIASSFTKGDKMTCASDPAIDNYIKCANTLVYHDGYEFTRQDKIRNVCNILSKTGLSDDGIPIRVCLKSKGDYNCCNCEKCYRTIFGILAEGKNPENFDFHLDSNFYEKVERQFKNEIILLHPYHWIKIQKRFIENKDIFVDRPELQWVFKYNFYNVNRHPSKYIRKYLKAIFRRLKKFLKGGYWHGKCD